MSPCFFAVQWQWYKFSPNNSSHGSHTYDSWGASKALHNKDWNDADKTVCSFFVVAFIIDFANNKKKTWKWISK